MLFIKLRKKNEEPSPAKLDEEGSMEVIPVLLDNILEISSIKLDLPDDLTKNESKIYNLFFLFYGFVFECTKRHKRR